MVTHGFLEKLKLERLNYELPEFPVRISWTSDGIRREWEPRIASIEKAWERVERHKESCLTFSSEERLPELIQEMKKINKIVIPLKKEGISQGYGNSIPFTEGRPYRYRVVITDVEKSERWITAYDAMQYNGEWNRDIGSLLGYPPCCIAFFQHIWVNDKYLDTTWPMAANSICEEIEGRQRTFNIPTYNNILLRWLGVRLVSHLPCSLQCKDTRRIASENADYFRILGYRQELEWIEELLSLPITWSALHGIAEVKTPLFRFIARTDATGEEYKVSIEGRTTVKDVDIWTDNGFSSLEVMNKAHENLREITERHVKGKVLDLGCGNGFFLKKLDKVYSHNGVDVSPAKIKKCKEIFPLGKFYASSIFSYEWAAEDYDVIFIALSRIFETKDADLLLEHLRRKAYTVIVYSYDEGINQLPSTHKHLFDRWSTVTEYNRVTVLTT